MKIEDKITKIQSIINSCETLDQVKTCKNFMYLVPKEYQQEIVDSIVDKSSELKNK
jgi:hypothetical protein